MFLALFACQLALVAASPFHKYPYVFLLDVGNEELEKTNTEQIRISVPGGSIAIRYPAVGTGDTIAHVRVSGIDFDTDLKANIVDGGPGYKYVVLTFMGNQGAPYDAVMTVQTVSDEVITGNQKDVSDRYNDYEIEEDNNDSGEITNDSSIDKSSFDDENVSSEQLNDGFGYSNDDNKNAEITQQSSYVYSYANSADEYEDNEPQNNKDIHKQYSDSSYDAQAKSSIDDDVDDKEKISDNRKQSNSKDNYEYLDSTDGENQNNPIENGNNKDYGKYQSAIPLRAFGGMRVYPQYAVPFTLPDSDNTVYSDVVDSDHTADDDDDRISSNKYRDTNNNYFDSNDVSAIES